MKKDTSKSTMLVLSMGFLILYFIFDWQWAVKTSLALGLIGILSVKLSIMIEKGWMKLAAVLNRIMPPVLLMVIFYLVLFPISLISKLFTKDPLMLSDKYDTYFITINEEFDKKSFEKMW